MTTLFYIVGLLPFLMELDSIANAARSKKLSKSIRNKIDQGIEVTDMETQERHYAYFQSFYMFWVLAGLITFQWIIFLVILLMSMTRSIIFRTKDEPLNIRIVDSVISALLILFIILNKWHFGIDPTALVMSLF